MAENPPIPRDIEAVLDRCVGEMRERLASELSVAETEADKLEILACFSREIGDVRGKVSGRAGISIGKRWALIGAGLAVFGAGVATASLWPRPQAMTPTAVEAPKGDDVNVGAGEPLPARPKNVNQPGIFAPGTPEAAKARGDAEDSAKAEEEASRARVEADVSMNTHIRTSLLKLYTMLETGTDGFGNPLSDSGRKENEDVIADFEAAFKERGGTDADIAKLKAEAKAAGQSSGKEATPEAILEAGQEKVRIRIIIKALITNKVIDGEKALDDSEVIALTKERNQLQRKLGLSRSQMQKIQEEVRASTMGQ